VSLENNNVAIQSAQLTHLLAVSARTVFASCLLAIVLVVMQGDEIPRQILLGWLWIMLAVSATRILVTRFHAKHHTDDPHEIRRRLTMFRSGLILSSMIWGAVGLLMIRYGQLEQQLFVSYLIAGLSAGSIVSYSIDRISAMTYIAFAVLPTLLGFAVLGHSISVPMAIAGVVYVIFSIFSIQSFYRNLLESVLLRQQATEREEEIKRLAFYDALTNLPNRRLLMDRLHHALVLSRRSGKRGALLFLDLDHFKMLNDTLGHDMGDLLLKQVAERLKLSVRESDTVARLGGDEFVVMLEDLNEEQLAATKQVEHITGQMIARLNAPYQLNQFEYISTPSIGIAMFGDHGESHEDLLKHADIAMYQAKKAGRNIIRMFDFKMRDTLHLEREH
jgi:diguanylate cyclase (GGDEF)-like protein